MDILQFWWVALLIGAVILAVSYSVKRYHEKKRAEQPLQAQFVVSTSFLVGCIFFIFNVVGIIAAILGIISGLFKAFLWWVGAK